MTDESWHALLDVSGPRRTPSAARLFTHRPERRHELCKWLGQAPESGREQPSGVLSGVGDAFLPA